MTQPRLETICGAAAALTSPKVSYYAKKAINLACIRGIRMMKSLFDMLHKSHYPLHWMSMNFDKIVTAYTTPTPPVQRSGKPDDAIGLLSVVILRIMPQEA